MGRFKAIIGSICIDDEGNQDDEMGMVTEIQEGTNRDDTIFKGIGFDGNPWSSKKPVLCAWNMYEYLKLFERELK